jgi:peptide/nickel transport system permease protein
MLQFIGKRALQSAFGLIVLFIAVFFLARLTGDPAKLLLPINADEALLPTRRSTSSSSAMSAMCCTAISASR